MARWMRVLAGKRISDPEGAQFRPRPQQSCIVCASGTGHENAHSRLHGGDAHS